MNNQLTPISFAGGSLGHIPLLEKVLADSIAKIDPRKLLEYGDPLGMTELLTEIAHLYGNGINYKSIMVTTSAQQALALIINHLSRNKKRIMVQEPAYFGLLRLLKKSSLASIPFAEVKDLEQYELGEAGFATAEFLGKGLSSLSPDSKSLYCVARK